MSAETRTPRARSPWVARAVKALGLGVFVVILARNPELVERSVGILLEADPLWCALGAACLFGTSFIGALRTRVFLAACGHRVSAGRLLIHFMQGLGLNAVVMGMAVVYRIERAHRATGDLEASVAAVLLDRLWALVSLAAGGVLVLALSGNMAALAAFHPGVAAALLAGLVLASGVGVVVFPRVARAVLARARPVLVALRARPSAFAISALYSVFGFAGTVAWVYCLGRGLGLPAPVETYAYAVPLVNLATIVPITIGGFGVREAGYAMLLAPAGVTKASGIALGVAQYVTSLLPAVVGAVWFLLEPDSLPDLRALRRRGAAASVAGAANAEATAAPRPAEAEPVLASAAPDAGSARPKPADS